MTTIIKLIFLIFLVLLCKALPEIRKSTEKIILGDFKATPATVKVTAFSKDSLKNANGLLRAYYPKNNAS